MASTPPPPSRIRTPPTPLHGAKYDDHDSFSPRRSSRISTMRDASVTVSSPAGSNVKDPGSRNPTFRRAPNHAISPPSSPSSPRKTTKSPGSVRKPKGVSFAGQRSDRGRTAPEPDSDLELDDTHLHSRLRGGNATAMLPTPVKTPKKRGLTSQAQLNSTARVLFPNRTNDLNELMPSPRRSRKGKKHNAYTLQSFAEECENDHGDDIPIFTDSKERVPMEDHAEDNPFITHKGSRKTRPSGTAEATGRTTKKSKYGMGEEIDRAVDNEEGVVYVFRGRKVFRKFDDTDEDSAIDPTDPNAEILRRAGAPGRFTRSTIKPRLLFPPKEELPDDHEDADEEAVTDIEGALPDVQSKAEKKVITPVKQQFRPVTPPTTGRKIRKPAVVVSSDSSPNGYDGTLEIPVARPKKPTPFDSWSRSKTGKSTSGTPAKRSGEPMEGDRGDGMAVGGKRTRSGNVAQD